MAQTPLVVLDTGVWSALYAGRSTPQADAWRGALAGKSVVIATQSRAELLTGFRLSDWDQRRRGHAVTRLDNTPTVPIDAAVIDAYVELTATAKRPATASWPRTTPAIDGSPPRRSCLPRPCSRPTRSSEQLQALRCSTRAAPRESSRQDRRNRRLPLSPADGSAAPCVWHAAKERACGLLQFRQGVISPAGPDAPAPRRRELSFPAVARRRPGMSMRPAAGAARRSA